MIKLRKILLIIFITFFSFSFSSVVLAAPELEKIPDLASMKYFKNIKKVGGSLYGHRIAPSPVANNSTIGFEKIPDLASMKYFKNIKKVGGSLYGHRITSQTKNNSNTSISLATNCSGLSDCIKYRNVEIAWEMPEDALSLVGKDVKSKYSAETITTIKTALDKYPAGMLARYLNRIYLLDGLTVRDCAALGTIDAHGRRIFMVAGQNSILTEQIVHHELAHILSFNPDNSYWLVLNMKKEFAAVNPVDFKYGATPVYASGNNIHAFSPSLAQAGFLTSYSTSHIEEDIAQMATRMFKNDPATLGANFWDLIDKYPQLRKKFDVMLKFYIERDPKFFSEQYFRGLK